MERLRESFPFALRVSNWNDAVQQRKFHLDAVLWFILPVQGGECADNTCTHTHTQESESASTDRQTDAAPVIVAVFECGTDTHLSKHTAVYGRCSCFCLHVCVSLLSYNLLFFLPCS